MRTAALICAALWCAGPAIAQVVAIQVSPADPVARNIICYAMLSEGTLELGRAWGINTMSDKVTRDATPQDIAAIAAVAAAIADDTIPAPMAPMTFDPPRPSVSLSYRPVLDTDFGVKSIVLPGLDVPAVIIPLFVDVFDGDCLDAGLDAGLD
jgi:hypothetical protein